MKLVFDSLDEAREFLAELDGEGEAKPKRTRKTKAEKEAEAAAIAANPNANIAGPGATVAAMQAVAAAGFGQGQQGFAAPAVAPAQQAPFAAPGATPAVHPLVAQIIDKTEASVAAGHPAESAVAWFRQALGPEAAQADWGQIKDVFLPRAPETLLKQIAPQFGITV